MIALRYRDDFHTGGFNFGQPPQPGFPPAAGAGGASTFGFGQPPTQQQQQQQQRALVSVSSASNQPSRWEASAVPPLAPASATPHWPDSAQEWRQLLLPHRPSLRRPSTLAPPPAQRKRQQQQQRRLSLSHQRPSKPLVLLGGGQARPDGGASSHSSSFGNSKVVRQARRQRRKSLITRQPKERPSQASPPLLATEAPAAQAMPPRCLLRLAPLGKHLGRGLGRGLALEDWTLKSRPARWLEQPVFSLLEMRRPGLQSPPRQPLPRQALQEMERALKAKTAVRSIFRFVYRFFVYFFVYYLCVGNISVR
jgi:hypothetical protein